MPDRPSGTVVFLFTDIVGSTKRWERHPAEMKADLARHDALLRRVLEAGGGYVFKTVGDAFCAAFPTAPQAARAAIAGQKALLAQRWEVPEGVTVRMALHAGDAVERDGDYFGPAVNRVARLLGAAHGSQIVLTAAAAELVKDALPAGAGMLPLGEHRLKDLSQPQPILQLTHAELPSVFPPLVTLDSRPNNLTAQPTPLVGREAELAEVTALRRAGDARLVTLTGPGGIGKTRLSLQAAADALDAFREGAFFVGLAPAGTAEDVSNAVLHALGIADDPQDARPPHARLRDWIGGKEMLLVLDNFEQVLPAAPRVGELLASCSRLRVLATSREPLRLRGEREYAVPPLCFPARGPPEPLEKLAQYEAVRLFIDRGTAVRRDFQVTNGNALAVAEICARLDGLPLAIELAAARLKVLTPQALLERLGDGLRLLTGGSRDLPLRQQTLRGAIDWSYRLLGDAERILLGRLSVFADGCTLEAAEDVCAAGLPAGAVLDLLASLVDKSLVKREERDGEPWFRMLGTIAEYARERLAESGEAEAVERLFADHLIALAGEAEEVQRTAAMRPWIGRLKRESANLLKALGWLRDRGDGRGGLKLVSSLGWYWFVSSARLRESDAWLRTFLDMPESRTMPAERAHVLFYLANALLGVSGLKSRIRFLDEALGLAVEAGDPRWTARIMTFFGWCELLEGRPEAAQAHRLEGVRLARETGDCWTIAICLYLGSLGERADREVQERNLLEARSLARASGDPYLLALCVHGMGDISWMRGDYTEAIPWYEECLPMVRDLGSIPLHLNTLVEMTDCRLGLDQAPKAEETAREGLRLAESQGFMGYLARFLSLFGRLAEKTGNPRRAARLFAASHTLRLSLADPHNLEPPQVPPDLPARLCLDRAAFEEEWAKGCAMSWNQATEEALQGGDAP